MRKLSGLSGGGSFFFEAAVTAFWGTASSITVAPLEGLLIDGDIASSRRESAMNFWHVKS